MDRRRFLKYAGATAAVVGASAVGLNYFQRGSQSTIIPTTSTTVPSEVTSSSYATTTKTEELIEDRFLRDDVFPINHDFALWLSRSNLYYSQFKENLDDYSTRIILAAAQMGELAPYAIRIPEIYTRQVPIGDVLRYLQSVQEVSVKETGAAQWILETGLLLEDVRFSDEEEKFLQKSMEKRDLLRLLVSEAVVQDKDYVKLKDFDPACDGKLGYLQDDVVGIPDVPDQSAKQLESIVAASQIQYQIRKGICLIDEYGIPNKKMFAYQVPAFNTQLQVLLWLAGDRVITERYSTIALAISLVYGSVYTIGSEDVRKQIRTYASQVLDFISDTDNLLKEQGRNWQGSQYPLEASIGLVHGTIGEQIILLGKRPEQPYLYPWYRVYFSRRMTSEEFVTTFIPYEILQDMQQYLIANKVLEVTSVPQVADRVAGMVPSADASGPSLDKDAAEANSIQRLWTDLKTKGTVKGDCGSVAHLECSLLRSVGISPLYGRYYENSKNRFIGHVFSAYYESSEGVYRTNSHQISLLKESLEGTIGTGYCKYPWDNFKTEKGTTEVEAYSPAHSKWFTANPANVYSLGVPAGYVFRQFKPRFTPEDH